MQSYRATNPYHIPVFPPPLLNPSFPPAYADIIEQKTFEDVVKASSEVQNHTKTISNSMSFIAMVICTLLFGYSLFYMSMTALFVLAFVWLFTAYGLDAVFLPLAIVLDKRYVTQLQAAMTRVSTQHSLDALGVTLRVRPYRGVYRQPWQMYPKRFHSDFKVAIVLESEAVQPIEYSLGLCSSGFAGVRYAWEREYPKSLTGAINEADWASAVTSLQRSSSHLKGFDALYIAVPIVIVVALIIVATISIAALPATDVGGIIALVIIVLFIGTTFSTIIGGTLIHRTRTQRRRAALTADMTRACSILNMAGSGAHWTFGWKSDAVGFTRSFIATPTITVTTGDIPMAPPADGLLGDDAEVDHMPPQTAFEAYPVMDRTQEGPRTGLLSQRVRGDDADEYV